MSEPSRRAAQTVMERTLATFGSLLVLSACGGAPPVAQPAPRVREAPVAPDPINEDIHDPLWVSDVGFKTPESVLYDARADVYLVSNIDGSPLGVDDSAFISRVRPDG